MEKKSQPADFDEQKKWAVPRSSGKRVSSRDVARHAGVSQTTVSFVLSGREGVSIPEETRKRVLASAAHLGYLPSRLASGLLRGRTQSIGVVMLSSIYPWLMFGGMQTELAKANYVPVFLSSSWCHVYARDSKIPTGFKSNEVANIHRLIEQQVDGLLYYSIDPTHTDDCLNELISREIPVVLVDNDTPGVDVDFVGCDEEEVGRLAARHLMSLNHDSFVLARYPGPFVPAMRRVAGFGAELEAAGLRYESIEVEEEWEERVADCLSGLVKPPAAVFACNDIQAAVVLRAARMIGWRVPEDLAIVGVGLFDISKYTDPQITTIHRQTREVGRRAAKMLLERINGYDGPPRKILLQPSLEVRASTVSK